MPFLKWQIIKISKEIIPNSGYNNTGGSINWSIISRNNLITVIRSLTKMFKAQKWILGTCLEVPVRAQLHITLMQEWSSSSTSREMSLGLMQE